MNDKVYRVVAENILSAEIVIQGNGEAGHGAVRETRVVSICKQRLPDRLPRDFLEMKIGILGYIRYIVELPRTIKGIPVDCQKNNR
jgi:hypothetical protein